MNDRSAKLNDGGSDSESHHGCQDWCDDPGDGWGDGSFALPPASDTGAAASVECRGMAAAPDDDWVWC